MSSNEQIITGSLNYKEIDFTFVLYKNELKLIPPMDKREEIEWNWSKKEIKKGVFTFGDPIRIEEKYIEGFISESNQKIILFPTQGSILAFRNSTIIIEIESYIICKYDRETFNKITITCPELNVIFPITQALSININSDDYFEKGLLSLNTIDFENTITDKQVFIVDQKQVSVYFSISRTVSKSNLKPPLELKTCLSFEFDATDDYSFIQHLWHIARDFIRFLCYRNNISISSIHIFAPCLEGKHEEFATMHILTQEVETETYPLEQGRCIPQCLFVGKEGKIMADIANGSLYLRHLPDSFVSGRHINEARFVLITSAFEWEYKRLYPDGIKKSDKTIEAEKYAIGKMQELINTSTGKKKEIFKRLFKLINSDPLSEKIKKSAEDFADIIGCFGEHLYKINNAEMNYSEMGKRLADQRNDFAHGNIDKDINGLSLLDLMFMEFLIYAMQLKKFEIDDLSIRKSINYLFHQNFVFEDK